MNQKPGMNTTQRRTGMKPSVNQPGSNKLKQYKALNMRQPPGASILELQQMERSGHLLKQEIGDEHYAGDMLYAFEDRFTDIELEKFKEAFVFFDRQGDGTMAASDVVLAMRAMGALVTEQEVKNLLKKYDPDRTGTIDVNDFIACMAEVVNKEDNEHEIRNAFSVFDKDENGLLPIDEMRHVLTRIGDPLSHEEITNYLNILDIHGDGYIRLSELEGLLMPQTNKDIYAKTVGGEGIERSHMSYGAPQLDNNKMSGGGQMYGMNQGAMSYAGQGLGAANKRQIDKLQPQAIQDLSLIEESKNGGSPQGGTGSASNSGQKKYRKGGKKQGGSTSNGVGSNTTEFYLALMRSNQEQLEQKYKDIPGACEWFIHRRQELESQKKSTAGLPHQQQWKPPRIDQERYQCAPIEDKPNTTNQAEQQQPQLQETILTGRKRLLRSVSQDKLVDQDPRPLRRVKYDGEQLIQPQVQSPIKQDIKIEKAEKSNEKQVYEVRDPRNQDDEKMKDYLELCDFIMRDSHSNCNGLWLKGSISGYIEKALQLLHSYDYNFTVAKFHILYPSVMAVPDRKQEIMESLTNKELDSIVQDAIIDLRGCKSQEAEEALGNLRTALNHRLTIEDLSYYQQVLKKLRLELPPDVEEELSRAREFSKTIKRRCGPQTGGGAAAQIPQDKKLKMSELLQMLEESETQYKIITPEMQQLQEYVKKAKQWVEKAEQVKNQVVNVKQLQNILQEARSIPVNFENLMEDMKKRSIDSQQLVDKIYDTFIKVTKTRTQINSSGVQQELSKKEKKNQDSQHSKKDKKHKEHQFRALLAEADILSITNPEVQKLREHLEDVDNWKNRTQMFLEDEREQRQHREYFNQLIKETALYKFELDLTEELQRKLEFIEWHEKVLKIYDRIMLGKNYQNSSEEDVCMIQLEVNEVHIVQIEELQSIMQEGEQKGFSDYQVEAIQKVGEICLKVNEFQTEIQKTLQQIKDSKIQVSLERVLQLRDDALNLRVKIEELDELKAVINEALQFEQQCLEMISRQDPMKIQIENTSTILKDILSLRQQVIKLGLSNKNFKQFCKIVKPLLRWIRYSRLIIKAYYKTLDLQLNQLNLLDQQDYESDSSNESEEESKEENIEQKVQKVKRRVPNQDYDLLLFLLELAENTLSIVKNTRDYQILSEIHIRVNQWIQKIKDLDQVLSSQQSQGEQVENLEKLVQEQLPLPNEMLVKLQKQLKREKWLKRLNELYNSEKVKIKTIETLAKDSLHADIQENEHCKIESEKLREQLNICRDWINAQNTSDLNSQKDIAKLLELGKPLLINLVDYVELKLFYQDVIDWRSKTFSILNDPKNEANNYEELRRHIDLGIQLDITDQEFDILKDLVEMCAHWKSIARKIIQSRVLSKLEVQEIVVQESLPMSQTQENQEEFCIILQKLTNDDNAILYTLENVKTPSETQKKSLIPKVQYFDNQKYCLCRRGDDGLEFMIECDSCKEWFHGDCIGLNKQITTKLQSYICIGCARLYHNYEPKNPQKVLDEQENEIFDIELLHSFSSLKRVQYPFFLNILEEAKKISIYLEEEEELQQLKLRIDDWFERIEPQISNIGDQSDDSSEIISTKTVPQLNSQSKDKTMNPLDNNLQVLHKLYLESESFPVEIQKAEELMIILKQKRWQSEASKVLSATVAKANKAQQKKSIKKLLAQMNELKLENDSKSQHLANQLNHLLSLQNPNSSANASNSKQNQPMMILSGGKTGGKMGKSQIFMQQSIVQQQLDQLFKSPVDGKPIAAEYGNCISLVDYFEKNPQFIFTEDDRVKMEEFKALLSAYSHWLNQIRNCLNQNKKNHPQMCRDFQQLMQEGDQEFWMIQSIEKNQYLQIQDIYHQWINEASQILQNEATDNKERVILIKTHKYRSLILNSQCSNTEVCHLMYLWQYFSLQNIQYYDLEETLKILTDAIVDVKMYEDPLDIPPPNDESSNNFFK